MITAETLEIPKILKPSFDNRSLVEWFYHWEKSIPDEVYLRQPQDGKWITYTWKQVGEEARKMASYLKKQGLPPKAHVGIVSKNCAHWIIADLAIMMCGYVSVPFYPTLVGDQLGQVIKHSEIQFLFVGKLDEWKKMKPGIPKELPTVAFPENAVKELDQWYDKIKDEKPFDQSPAPADEDICTIIYTSGTTGTPKGVIYNHLQLKLVAAAGSQTISFREKRHRFFSYLPLCHVAERQIVELASLQSGGVVSFAESIDSFLNNLKDASPTIFFAVPRIWTKFQMGVLEKMPQKKLDTLLKIPILNNVVRKKIRKGLGINDAEYCFTAAAPCPPSMHKWYNALGVQLLELYGMTENVGACTVMTADNVVIGTVGKPHKGAELKIAEDSGEILMNAPWIMQGYYKEPALTAEVLQNGWLHTGDMGEIDKDGNLKITGRVKDTFKTSKGEFIVPGPIEWGYALNNYIEQICVLGRELPQPVALLVLSELGRKKSREELETSLVATMDSVNEGLIDYEKVKKIVVMKEPWTVENGILTPKLSIKRNVLEGNYEENLQSWYATEGIVVWA